MDIYVARQPIFDHHMHTVAYELLYRNSYANYFSHDNPDIATSELISNSFLSMKTEQLVNGTKAFINFPQKLIEDETPLLLPKDKIVIEILETVEPTEKVIAACKKFKSLGYTIALDDFSYQEEYLPLIELADIIKIEYFNFKKPCNISLMKDFKGKIQFLAEKVESREDYKYAIENGFTLFQGYFFSKPLVIKSQSIRRFNTTLLNVLDELNKPDIDLQYITELIEKDVGTTHNLLKLVNSVAFASTTKIYSIKQALVRIGAIELRKWLMLMLLQELRDPQCNELIQTCLVRAKFMELLAIQHNYKNRKFEFYLTGIFSSIHILLNQPMEAVLKDLPIVVEVKSALLGEDNFFKQYLDIILTYEQGDWEQIHQFINQELIDDSIYTLYQEALQWSRINDNA